MTTPRAASGGVTLRWLFLFFLASGCCSLVDEVVWLRMAMARFGVVAPLVATVLSVFMAGLGLGSWAGGWLAKRAARTGRSPLRLYALAELVIATSALFVPVGLDRGSELLRSGHEAAWGSLGFHLASGICVALVLLPFCFCMGATFPLGMAALRARGGALAARSFSYLYVANVLGATCGTLVAAFVLVELLGFRGTLFAAAALNVAIASAALLLAQRRSAPAAEPVHPKVQATPRGGHERVRPTLLLAMLFTTGLVSMAMEVVWVRQFTPYLGSVVYAFAIILAIYLAATFLGSVIYRRSERLSKAIAQGSGFGYTWLAAAVFGLMPLVATDHRLPLPLTDVASADLGDLWAGALRVALGLPLFCGIAGFLTPMLVDRYASGDPARAGSGYAVNVLGCIVGPLLSSFLLLPLVGERWAIAILALPLLALAPLVAGARATWLFALGGTACLACFVVITTRDQVSTFAEREVRRDYEATVVATTVAGQKQLFVNGIGITVLTPATKTMAHLPMAFHRDPPEAVLVICFGMGTTFRSALSWGVATTAVDLVPSVPAMIGYYHQDGAELLRSPLARVVIDDGRRFLERTSDRFDVITVDPPPPVEAAGSSLLYSREFYAVVRSRLGPGGILQQWFPGGEPAILSAVTRSITESFPHVRAFPAVEGWGYHFLASDSPLDGTPAVLANRLPPRAAADLVEWFVGASPEDVFARLLGQEHSVEQLLAADPSAPILTDDRPYNEYYFLRRLKGL